MENENSTNSPVIRSITPIRRLGLSRKRKSSLSQKDPDPKIQALGDRFPDSPVQSEKSALEKSVLGSVKDCEDGDNPVINYDDEIEVLKKKIINAEEKLQDFYKVNSNIQQLENLIDLWKKGCKNAYFQLIQFLQERQAGSVDVKGVLNKLGILETMIENFGSDPEFSISD